LSRPRSRRQACRALLGTAATLALLPRVGAADGLPDLIERAKPSVVTVGTYAETDSPRFMFRGTGFVVADGLHVLTNAHVLRGAQVGGEERREFEVGVWTAGGGWHGRRATPVHIDDEHDLALLRFEGAPVPALTLATGPTVREGSSIALMGFPLGGQLGFAHVTHRGIVAARVGVVLPAPSATALNPQVISQLRRGGFEMLQLDAVAYPGNSGGPVFDAASGEVVGIVNMVLLKGERETALSAPSGISYAIPVAQGVALLNEHLSDDRK